MANRSGAVSGVGQDTILTRGHEVEYRGERGKKRGGRVQPVTNEGEERNYLRGPNNLEKKEAHHISLSSVEGSGDLEGKRDANVALIAHLDLGKRGEERKKEEKADNAPSDFSCPGKSPQSCALLEKEGGQTHPFMP